MNPYLPTPDRSYAAEDIQALGKDRSGTFYLTALNYAQCLWLQRFPAKALLLINRALSCHLADVPLNREINPYQAVAWILRHRAEGNFIGNPRRHYQHLATRMVEPHKELRTWRAWACWYLSCKILPSKDFPADHKQIVEESIIEPRRLDIESQLARLSPSDDLTAWRQALNWLSAETVVSEPEGPISSRITEISPDDLPRIQTLAAEIWPAVYSSLIGTDQVQYMLGTMYPLNILRQEMNERGIIYAVIQEDESDVGYLAWEANPGHGTAYVHKLYLKPSLQGRGIGAHALQWIHQQALQQGLRHIRLRVNKNNLPAIRAYLRQGYQFEMPIVSDIGNGFVMDDYLMGRPLGASAAA